MVLELMLITTHLILPEKLDIVTHTVVIFASRTEKKMVKWTDGMFIM